MRSYFYSSATLILCALLASCRGYDIRLFQGWDRLELDCCYVQYQEGMDTSKIRAAIEWKWPTVKAIQERFFPQLKDFKPLIVVYPDQESYNRSSKHLPDNALAHYDRSRKAIHVSVDASDAVWRHEMSHLYLDEVSSPAPFWFQEGLARFLQNYNTQKPTCSPQAILPEFKTWVEKNPESLALETLDLPTSVDFMDPTGTVEKTVLSGVFVYFLWTRGDLTKVMRGLSDSPRSDPLFHITYGERGAMNKLRLDYISYLERPVFNAAPANCSP